jgi:MFS transporter, UMF1 family
VLYDLANTIFALGVVGLYLPAWMTENNVADSWLAGTQTLAAIVVVFAAPWIGAHSDRRGRRMPTLVVTTLVAIAATATLTVGPRLLTFAALGVALIAVNTGSVVYDALLPHVSTPNTRGRVSGLGVGIGYFGSFVGLGLGILFLDVLETGYWTAFLAMAAGFLLFSLPAFAWIHETPHPHPGPSLPLSAVATDLVRSWRDTRLFPGLTRFLVGRFLYTDAINTLIGGFLTVFAIEEIGLDREGSQALLGSAIVGAIVGGLGGGRLVERFRPTRVLRWALIGWIVAIGLAVLSALLSTTGLVPIIGPLGGMSLGATWASDRVLMTRITPPARLGEFYGLYATVGRFATIVGPLLWAVIVDVLGWGRVVAILALAASIAAGWWVVGRVDDRTSVEVDHA